MCGALDCPSCHPGCDTIVQCDFCGEYMPKHMANEERKNYKGIYFCDDCHGNIKECYYCGERIHIDDENLGDWSTDEHDELTCPKCVAEAKEEGVWYGK
jgi:hypothetical protein